MKTASPPRAFISYSWSTPTHESWVVSLATRLREDGVDAVLDKWDLKPGHDAIQFMEQMVTDPTIRKVIIICDRIYSEKADGRTGGVGTESQIISPEIYGKAKQDKFAAVITELDADGKPCAPTYYKGRIYFDFTADEKFETKYDELLRWLLDKPSIIKPSLGRPPAHIVEATTAPLGTTSDYRRALEAIRSGNTNSRGAIRDFCENFIAGYENFRISTDSANQSTFDDVVVASISSAVPYVRQVQDITVALCRYGRDPAEFDPIIRLLEKVLQYVNRPKHIDRWSEWDFDNYAFLAHEFFLTVAAICLKEERFDLATKMVEAIYIQDNRAGGMRVSGDYTTFRPYLKSLLLRSERAKIDSMVIHATILKERYSGHYINFGDIAQADFVLYLREATLTQSNSYASWYPLTLTYEERYGRPFEIFARSESKSYFDKFKRVLAVQTAKELESKIAAVLARPNTIPRIGWREIDLKGLANVENLSAVD